ncbi:hypothetical protein BKA83DRAFT_4128562 [Pisolithus microcarpus]|nr:hypothetical protein BKA83DRAFT_4128562 [Pisolithus microcarpus]
MARQRKGGEERKISDDLHYRQRDRPSDPYKDHLLRAPSLQGLSTLKGTEPLTHGEERTKRSLTMFRRMLCNILNVPEVKLGTIDNAGTKTVGQMCELPWLRRGWFACENTEERNGQNDAIDHRNHKKTTLEGSEPSKAVKLQGHQAPDPQGEHTKRSRTMWMAYGRDHKETLVKGPLPVGNELSGLVNRRRERLEHSSARSRGFGAPEFSIGLVPVESYPGDTY